MITSEAVRFIPFHYIAFAIFQSAFIRHIFDVFYTLRPRFKGNRIIDVVERTGLWETCGFRAGGAAQVSPSVGVLSAFSNRAFSSFTAIMVVSPLRSAPDRRSHSHTL